MLVHAEFTNWFWLVAAILSVWRVASLLCYESGPFEVLTAFRKVMFRLKMGGVVQCFHCMGVWVSIAAVLIVFTPAPASIIMMLAVSGGASIIERYITD